MQGREVQDTGAGAPAGHVVLVGLMGSGKSAVGALLAERLGRPMLDNDELLEERTGSTAARLAERLGADALHDLELEVMAAALDRTEPAVVTAAASVVDDPRSHELLGPHTVVWLTAGPDVLADRVDETGDRPFLGDDAHGALRTQARRRDPGYALLADTTVDTTSLEPAEVAERLVAVLGGRDGEHGFGRSASGVAPHVSDGGSTMDESDRDVGELADEDYDPDALDEAADGMGVERDR